MKKITSAIVLITLFFSNLAFAQQNNKYEYQWSSGSTPDPVKPSQLKTGSYTFSHTFPAEFYVDPDVPTPQEADFNSKVAKLEQGNYGLDKAVKELVALLLYDVEDTQEVSMNKMSALGTIDLIFANNLLSIDKELSLILFPLYSVIGKGGRAEAWASIGLGLVANYYPTADIYYSIHGKSTESQLSVLDPNYNPRDPQYRSKIEALFKKYILDDDDDNIETRMHMAEAIGFDKSSTWKIESYINKLNERLSYSQYTEGPNGSVVFSLCRALAYQATVYQDRSARNILEKFYGGIYSKDQISNPYPWATMVYSAMAAGSYEISSAYRPLGIFAMWGNVDNIFETGGIKVIPFNVRKMTWSVLPVHEKNRIRKEQPDALYNFTEYDEDGNEIQLDQPLYTSAEYWATTLVDGLNQTADFLIMIVCWEMAGYAAMTWAVSTEFAIANSMFAETVGYIATVGAAGKNGSKMAVAAYERWLIMNSAKYAVTFAETPVGILFNRIGKGIKNFFTKFAPQITILKRGVVVTSTVLNLNVATLSARTLPQIMPKATAEWVLTTAEKQTLNTAGKIISATPSATTMAETELLSLLEKTGMDLVSATKYVNVLKSTGGASIPAFTVMNTGTSFIQTTIDVIFDGKSNLLTIQSDIPGEATFSRVFKFKDGGVKSYSGLTGGPGEPPIVLSAAESDELARLISEYDKTCKGLI